MKIGLVIPTITGREEVLDLVLGRYGDTVADDVEFDVTISENYPTVGEAWNAGYADVADSDFVFFSVDDLEPHVGWEQVAASTVEEGWTPAPRLVKPDGVVESCGSMGLGAVLPEAADRTPCRNTGVIFTTPTVFEQVGAFLPIHYACDDDWNWRNMIHGRGVLYREAMLFTHHDVKTGNEHNVSTAQDQIKQFIQNAASQQLPQGVVV